MLLRVALETSFSQGHNSLPGTTHRPEEQGGLTTRLHIAHRFCCLSLQEVGPTMVGDEHSDPSLMRYLGATKRNMLGNHL